MQRQLKYLHLIAIWRYRAKMLEHKTVPVQQFFGIVVFTADNGQQSIHFKRLAGKIQHRSGCFEGISHAAIVRQQGVSNVAVIKRLTVKQASHADWQSGFGQLNKPQAKTMFAVAGNGTTREIPNGIVKASNFPIANIADKRWIIEQGQHKPGIFLDEFPDVQARR
jgi:hypothetical protein